MPRRASSTNSRRRKAIPIIRFRGAENSALYKQYQALAEETPGVHFVGRLASYRYYNMDQVVGAALTLYKKIGGQRRVGRTALVTPARSALVTR